MSTTDDLSEYEKVRLANIARNQRVLEALGLVSADIEQHQAIRGGSDASKNKRQKLAPNREEDLRAAVRRSQRLAGLPADECAASPSSSSTAAQGTTCSGAHDAAREEYEATWSTRWSGKQKGSSIVGTASYAHTLMRVMSMSEVALANRIKAIERACGQHAVVKMKLFATVLTLEGYCELAEEAASAFDRLVEKLGEPRAAATDDEDGSGEKE